jgi:hypothetical protein
MAKKSSPTIGAPTTQAGITPTPQLISLRSQYVPYSGIQENQLSQKRCICHGKVSNTRNFNSLAALIRDFITKDMLRWCNCVRRNYAIDQSVKGCYIADKRCCHLLDISTPALQKASAILMNASLPSSAYNDFDALYDELRKILAPIKGLGPLCYYDIALRIGYHLRKKLMPEKYVYIQSGAYAGAKVLQAKGYIASSIKLQYGSRIPLSAFDPEIQQMSCHLNAYDASTALMVEDFLCVCDNDFKKLPPRPVKLTTYLVAVPASAGNFDCHICNNANNAGNYVPC